MRGLNPIVEDFQHFAPEGDLIPHAWYQHPLLQSDNDKREKQANTKAIIILAHIVYWYRPTVEMDEATGRVVAMRQKFRADALQVNYAAWAKKFGLTKRVVQDTFAFLKRRGLIELDYRTVTTDGGMTLGNVVYAWPIVSKIKEISDLRGITKDSNPSHEKTGQLSPHKVRANAEKGETYTKTPTKIPTKNTHTQQGAGVSSRFSLEECRRYAESLKGKGINSPGGYATAIYRSGEADALIESFLRPVAGKPSTCRLCATTGGFIYADESDRDKGVKPCNHIYTVRQTAGPIPAESEAN